LIAEYQNTKRNIEIFKQNKTVNTYNASTNLYNEAVNQFNDFIEYRNKQFTPTMPDALLVKKIEDIEVKINDVENKLKSIDKNINGINVNAFSNSLKDIKPKIAEQKEFVDKYVKASKFKRKILFYKITYFGIPLN
jgi:muramidase (phage lysozyme)